MSYSYREVKTPTTYSEQISLLQSRGCIIDDEAIAKCFLKRVNYYRFSGYFHVFKQKDGSFFNDVTFDTLASAYSFDQELRALLIKVVSEIELTAKSIIAYHHSHLYGATGYQDANNFSEKHNHSKFMKQLDSVIKSNYTTPFVKHHFNVYGGKLPLWVATELFTMGMVSLFYADLKITDKKDIAKEYDTDYVHLESWLHSTSVLRNICAHYARTYPTAFRQPPKLTKVYAKNKSIGVYSLGRQLCMLKLLCTNSKADWNNAFVLPLTALMEKYENTINLDLMGLPSDWEKVLSW